MNDPFDEAFLHALKTFQNGETERAEDLCSEILKQNPKHGNSLNLLGIVYLKQGALERARDCIMLAMQNFPQKAPIFSYNLALVYMHLGDIRSAAYVYKNAADAFRVQGEAQEALNCLEKGALLLRSQGHLSEAKNFYLTMLEIDPTNIFAHNDFGILLQMENNLDGAITCFEHVLQLNPTFSPAYNNLGLIFQQLKRFKEAILFFSKAADLDTASPEAHINLGNIFSEEEKLDKALYHYQLALEIAPNHPGIFNNLGIIYHRQGNLEQAIIHYKKALELDPNYEQAREHLAVAEEDRQGNLTTEDITLPDDINHQISDMTDYDQFKLS